MDFTTWLQSELNTRDWSNAELARHAGVSRARITQVLGGDTVSADFCVKIAHALGLPTVQVLRRAGFPVIQSPPELSGWEADAWTAVQQLAPEHRDAALKMLRALVE